MRDWQEDRIEELSKEMGGEFKLTALIQKRMVEFYKTGKTFMPDVESLDELYHYVLDEIAQKRIQLLLPEQQESGEQ